jgi:polyhydroxyalkanoate synthesis regulator phasin
MSNSVQEVRDRIIKLAREIEEFSKSNVPPETFFTEFLRRVVGAVGARAGIVWLKNDANRLEMVAEVGLAKTTFNDNPAAAQINHSILVEVMSNGQACMYHPGETDVELPTEDMLVLAGLQQDKEVLGVVEIFQRNDTPAQARPGFLQFVEQMSGYACRYLDKQNSAEEETGLSIGSVAEEFETFIMQLHNSLEPRDVAFTAANDGRLLIKADRVSVAVLDGKKTVIRAVSGQEKVNQRANLVRKMTKLAARVIKTKEKLIYKGKIEDLAPKVETALADFIQESGSRMVTVIPLFQPDPLIEKEEQTSRPKEKIRKPVGGLIIEQIAESQPKAGVLEAADLIADHVGSAIYNAKTYNRLFMMPVWRGLGKIFGFLEGRNGVKAALILLLLTSAVVAMIMIPSEYRVAGEGQLYPVDVADVFAPWDGEVVSITAISGKRVKKGDLLLTIKSDDLTKELQVAVGSLRVAIITRRALESELGNTADPNKRTEIIGRIAQKQKEVESLRAQVDILKRRVESLEVRAPRAGVVATFQLKRTLLNRPVRRGEMLIEIKDDQGEWHLELEVAEHRMGHLLRAQLRQKKIGLKKIGLNVEFHLGTNAVKKYKGKIKLVEPRTNSSQESGSVVVVLCSFDKSQLEVKPRIGADVRAKIDCGQRSWAYCWFGDVAEFFQKYFWL